MLQKLSLLTQTSRCVPQPSQWRTRLCRYSTVIQKYDRVDSAGCLSLWGSPAARKKLEASSLWAKWPARLQNGASLFCLSPGPSGLQSQAPSKVSSAVPLLPSTRPQPSIWHANHWATWDLWAEVTHAFLWLVSNPCLWSCRSTVVSVLSLYEIDPCPSSQRSPYHNLQTQVWIKLWKEEPMLGSYLPAAPSRHLPSSGWLFVAHLLQALVTAAGAQHLMPFSNSLLGLHFTFWDAL